MPASHDDAAPLHRLRPRRRAPHAQPCLAGVPRGHARQRALRGRRAGGVAAAAGAARGHRGRPVAGTQRVALVFQAKVALARATAALSRASGRGGGTTLPGRLLLAVEPDAIGRLASGLRQGSAVISATNGKTTTAKMAASILSPPLHLTRNAAGANLASGIASALVRDHDADLGVFEVDEAALDGVARAL